METPTSGTEKDPAIIRLTKPIDDLLSANQQFDFPIYQNNFIDWNSEVGQYARSLAEKLLQRAVRY